MAEDTIEWGDKRPARRGWLARLTAEPPPEGGADDSRPRLNYPGLVLAGLGFVAILAGQYLPWLQLNLGGNGGNIANDLPFTSVYAGSALVYGLSTPLALAGAATVLAVSAPTLRRGLAAATLGLLGGQLAVLVGLAAGLSNDGAGANVPVDTSGLPDGAISLGPGYLLALVAIALLAASVIVAARAARSRRTTEKPAAAKTGEEPMDLVVTPLPSESVDIRSERPPFGG
jgi:hypothetical protein